MLKVLFLYGTRPEAIKMAPLVLEMRSRPAQFAVRCGVTAQHRGLLDQVHDAFGIVPDFDLDIMTEGQSMEGVAVRALERLVPVLEREDPGIVLVQGDTTTTMISSLAAFYRKVPVGHVEAGLRTLDRYSPFPEEINRRVTSVLATLHFAPTETARQNLLRAGVPEGNVYVTGNTVIDALLGAARLPHEFEEPELRALPLDRRIVVVTAHRRESHGEPMIEICSALGDLARRNPEVSFVFPVHPNPNVRGTVSRHLSGLANVLLLPPLPYVAFVHLMKRAFLFLTDSGGMQEEGPGLGKPVLVMREVTERPEAVEAGTARLVGRDRRRIVEWVERLLTDQDAYRRMAEARNPYGDGHAAERIADIVWTRGSSGAGWDGEDGR